VVLLVGGNGVLGLGRGGSIEAGLRFNFLIRSRELFARQSLYVAVLDAPSDRGEGMNGAYRLTLQHAREIGAVIAHLKSRLDVPVWLVGTSSSSISAANAAARLPIAALPRADGIVMTSSLTVLTSNCRRTVHDASLSAIRVPVLVVSHRDDGCECSPGSAASGATLLAALTGTSRKDLRVFTGGSTPLSGPCRPRAPHGFFGIEERVVKAIADWIKAR
jgi:pimeloyl-ACP methyl ester carboxylesterase